jgi:K(+)-stimulated pyrophosphate-energized sodium pump
VGDNVGDCAGMAADLFESYAVTLVAALILGSIAFGSFGLVFPLIIPAIGALTALLGVYVTKARDRARTPCVRSTAASHRRRVSTVLCAIAAYTYLPKTFAELGSSDATSRPWTGTRAWIALAAVIIGIVLAGVILADRHFTGTEDTDPSTTSPAPRSPARPPSSSPASGGSGVRGLHRRHHRWRVYLAFLLGGGSTCVWPCSSSPSPAVAC